MATYTVRQGQNIFDIAVHCHGSIEGVFDLLISNPKLSMDSVLKPGQVLVYHDSFAVNSGIRDMLQNQGVVPANGERHVYYKEIDQNDMIMMFAVDPDAEECLLKASGDGVILVDWGDDSDIETIRLHGRAEIFNHFFDNKTDKRRVKLYANTPVNFDSLDISEMYGQLYLMKECVVDEYTNISTDVSLAPLFLFKQTYKVDLKFCHISDLSPLISLSLQELDLRFCAFPSIEVVDDYLEGLVENYGSRRPCTVYLSVSPSERGMAAIQTIINEPSWNSTGKWTFVINDTTYKA